MCLMVLGGGIGGYIYLVLVLIEWLKQVELDIEVFYVGVKWGLEMKIVFQVGYWLEIMEVQGFWWSFLFENVKIVYFFLKVVVQVKKLIKDFCLDVVLGIGGYVFGVVLYVVVKLGVLIVIYE